MGSLERASPAVGTGLGRAPAAQSLLSALPETVTLTGPTETVAGAPFCHSPSAPTPPPGLVFWMSPSLAQRLRGSHGAQWLCEIQETAADAPPESMWKVKLPAPLSSVGLSVLTTSWRGFITLYLRPSDLYPYVMKTGLDGSHCNCQC